MTPKFKPTEEMRETLLQLLEQTQKEMLSGEATPAADIAKELFSTSPAGLPEIDLALDAVRKELQLISVFLGLESSDKHIRSWAENRINDGSLPLSIIGRTRKIKGVLQAAQERGCPVLLRCPQCKRIVSASVAEANRWLEVAPEVVGVPCLDEQQLSDWPRKHDCPSL